MGEIGVFEQVKHPRRQCLVIVEIDQQAGHAVLNHVGDAPGAGRDDRQPAGEGFENGARQVVDVGGVHRNVVGVVQDLDAGVIDAAVKGGRRGQPQFAGQLLQPPPFAAVADHRQGRLGKTGLHPGEGADDAADVVDLFQAAGDDELGREGLPKTEMELVEIGDIGDNGRGDGESVDKGLLQKARGRGDALDPAHERSEQGFVAGEKVGGAASPRAEDDGDAGELAENQGGKGDPEEKVEEAGEKIDDIGLTCRPMQMEQKKERIDQGAQPGDFLDKGQRRRKVGVGAHAQHPIARPFEQGRQLDGLNRHAAHGRREGGYEADGFR